jgi:hypothetical protein
MKSNIFNKVLSTNKKFWNRYNKKNDISETLLYEALYPEQLFIYGISKTALIISNILNMTPVCIRGINSTSKNIDLVKSMNVNVLGSKYDFILSFIHSIFAIFRVWAPVKSRKNLLDLHVGKYRIGIYIYDHLLPRFNSPTLDKFNFKVRLIILMEIGYFFFFRKVVLNKNVKFIVIGDYVYRYGFLFEIAKQDSIPCITPINLNMFAMRKYVSQKDYETHDRAPDKNILNTLEDKIVNERLTGYFNDRFSASMEQHDVIKAFSSDKEILVRKELIDKYKLNKNMPIVVIMAHIFCDAPHGYPNTLYDDYYEWVKRTVINLKKNKNVNFLVKEHPSADLYNECGILKKLLKSLGSEQYLLDEETHTLSILNECDVVVTCGGTIGQEFLYRGKQVVLAAKPSYSGFGVTTEFNTKSEYESFLRGNMFIDFSLSEDQQSVANKLIYYDFMLLDNYSNNLEIGGQRYFLGREFNYDEFYNSIITYNQIPLCQQNIFKLLKKYIESDKVHLINNF